MAHTQDNAVSPELNGQWVIYEHAPFGEDRLDECYFAPAVKGAFATDEVPAIGSDPHPSIMGVFKALKDRVLSSGEAGEKKLYVRQSPSQSTQIENEAEIEALLVAKGFEVVSLETLSLEELISLFRNVRIIVAPHDAGLAYLGFAEPGTKVLELHNPSHVDWRMKKLATLARLQYGQILGVNAAPESLSYRVDVSKIDAAVAIMRQ